MDFQSCRVFFFFFSETTAILTTHSQHLQIAQDSNKTCQGTYMLTITPQKTRHNNKDAYIEWNLRPAGWRSHEPKEEIS